MGCSVKEQKQIIEAAKKEYKRLHDLQSQGYTEDLENNIYDIDVAMEKMKAIFTKKVDKLEELVDGEKKRTELVNQAIIDEINSDRPKYRNAPVKVISGEKVKGKIYYKIKYPNNDKEYTIKEVELELNQKDVRITREKLENQGSSIEEDIGKKNSDELINEGTIGLAEGLKQNFTSFLEYDKESGHTQNMELKKLYDKLSEALAIEDELVIYQQQSKEMPPKLVQTYQQKVAEYQKMQSELNGFAALTESLINTYQETLQKTGNGDLNLKIFETTIEETSGQINPRTGEAQIRWNKMSKMATLTEVFLHEVTHKMSSHIFKANPELKALVKDIRNQAIKSRLTYELFLEGIESPTQAQIKEAKMKFEYVFDESADVEEFYAYALTNEKVYNAIKDLELDVKLINEISKEQKNTLGEKLGSIFQKVTNSTWRAMSGRVGKSSLILAQVVKSVAEADIEAEQMKEIKRQEEELEKQNPSVSTIAKQKMEKIDEIIQESTDKVESWQKDIGSKTIGKVKQAIKKIPILNEFLETGISQYLWRTLTQDTTSKNVADMYAVFRHSKQQIEKHTTDIRNGVESVLTKDWAEYDEATKEAVRNVIIESDMAQFDAKTIKQYIENEEELDTEIKKREQKINKRFNQANDKRELSNYIEALTKYIVTGEYKGFDLKINAHEIHKVIVGTESKDEALVKEIDELVSLKALQIQDKAYKEKLKELLKDEKGIETVDKMVTMYRTYIDDMIENSMTENTNPIPKGYINIKENLIRYELVPENEVKLQEQVKMTKVEEEPKLVINGVKYYLMTGKIKQTGFQEGAIGIIGNTLEGIPLSSMLRRHNDQLENPKPIYELQKEMKELIKSIRDGKNKVEFGNLKAFIPVYNNKMEIVDYRMQLSKDEKLEYLPDRNMGFESIMSDTFSRSVKTSITKRENEKVVDTIIRNASDKILENPEDYVLIEEYTEDMQKEGVKREKRHDRWEYLPNSTKQYIRSKLKINGIMVHKDFVELMMGEKDVTIGNFAKFGMNIKKHPRARAVLMTTEAHISEVLSYVKQAMVVLNGSVLLGNTVSNMMVALNHGINPLEYKKKFSTRWQQLNEYNEQVQLMAELEVRLKSGEKVSNKIKQLKRQLKNNIWNELVEDGQYTPLVEDINVEEEFKGQLAQTFNELVKKKKMDGLVKFARKYMYIDKTSGFYKTMLKTVHYGDAITRQIIKEELEEKAIKKNGKLSAKMEREILNYLDQLLVNYGYTMNRWWNYSERVGGLMFMRYYLGQGKALISMTKKNPTKSGLIQLIQTMTGIDIADPLDTYTNSGLDGIAYRMMLNDAPGLLVEPNIFDLVPDMSSFINFR